MDSKPIIINGYDTHFVEAKDEIGSMSKFLIVISVSPPYNF